ncbi:MAG: TolC family protein, partial [Bacteroidetes bacterium]|nr:TolC family protein [Bacteroidota bacterium]
MIKRLILLFLVCCLLGASSSAQLTADTVRLSLPDAEKIFLDSNLLLLAQKYNVDAQKALVMQAKLWPNPNFGISHGLYSGTLNKFFPLGANDETTAALSQLIMLAGKRNKQVKIAQANARLSEYQFFDLLRTLKYTLRTDFFNIYYLQKSAKIYDAEITALQQVVNAFAQQEGKGYISQKEVVRIKAQLYSLQSEYNDLTNQINDVESELRLILQVKPGKYIDPLADTNSVANLSPAKYPLSVLIDSAYQNRTDLMIAKANTDINKLNYTYQKALAVPDLTLSLGYDEQGSFLTNFVGIGASIDLPFFNRNQGNIKSAKAMIEYSAASQKSTEATVSENVARSLQKAFAQDKLYQTIDPKFTADFSRLQNEVLINYQKRNLSILEFLDFYDSYKQNVLQINAIQYNRVQAF